ncbi:hypothetical protein [Stratiformator vulcanicus]|uniref:Uncharacterized protein n=1 Tax=Stratiformator vulcanicus TaxID=2527980 RepID=A0A517R1C0_9PLAN|nr:hypothetical protein [Stratiformator vulcanicus]QDT37643.1 hypothetical protein Pan189_20230 [Stratiformator vulcanicus]
MGYQSDWLYRLIVREISTTLERAKSVAYEAQQPERILVSEYAAADWSYPRCVGEQIRQWVFEGNELHPVDPSHAICNPEEDGVFFREVTFQFHIRPDRRRVAFTYAFGPRHGHGVIFDVLGQGQSGRLEQNREMPQWVS